ncbi:glutathione S-transferase family protein [Pseudomonas alliivorans]|nr:glutathione S-transferase family protein [Pseudomonas alliivorans]MEE4910105.1 glutathione S-transferase family protein [Pseudomonas alliivorans]
MSPLYSSLPVQGAGGVEITVGVQMSQSRLKLVSHGLCPFVQRVAILLLEKEIPFQRVDVDLKDRPEWFLVMSPTGKVPLLIVQKDDEDATVLFESVAICEYIEQVYPEPAVHPKDAITRAQHRAWIEFATGMLADAWGYLNAANQQTALNKSSALRGKLERLGAEKTKGPFFAGETFSMVDIAVAPVFRYFDILGFEPGHPLFDGLGRIAEWRHALANRATVKGAVAEDYAGRLRKHLLEVNAIVVC